MLRIKYTANHPTNGTINHTYYLYSIHHEVLLFILYTGVEKIYIYAFEVLGILLKVEKALKHP